MNIVTISVNGIEYKLKGEESDEYLNEIANEVDLKIREMINVNRGLTLQSSSILLAINYCDKIKKLQNEQVNLSNTIDECNVKIQNLINENSELKSKIINIENQKQECDEKIKTLESEIEVYNDFLKEEKDELFSQNNEILELEKEIEILKDTIKKINEENLKSEN